MLLTGDRVGVDRNTGKLIQGWAHCQQSIYVILTTRLNLDVMLLDFGSEIMDLLDQPGNAGVIARVYMAIYRALRKWEPGYRITKFQLYRAGKDGKFGFILTGIFYPRGHLGDYSISEPDRKTSIFV